MRQRVLQFYDNGEMTAAIAKRLAVSPAWCRRVKQHRDRPPRKSTGRPPKFTTASEQRLFERVAERPDATLEELRRWCISELKLIVSIGTIWSTLRRLKLALKKVADRPRAVTPGRASGTGRIFRRAA